MSNLCVSECFEKNDNVLYIRENLCELFFNSKNVRLAADRHRAGLLLSVECEFFRPACEDLCDKIADVIAIGYKYDFFSQKIKTCGLSENNRELLIAALIAADFEEDKRYVRARLQKCNTCNQTECFELCEKNSFNDSPLKRENIKTCRLKSAFFEGTNDFYLAIDGFFNFRLASLKKKWNEVAEYVPEYFSLRELNDFISYLLCEKKGRRVIIDGDRVYDKRFNRLKKSTLLGGKQNVVKEAILFGAGEVEVKTLPPLEDEKLLREYFGDKVYFS